jgi:hypothetical protein
MHTINNLLLVTKTPYNHQEKREFEVYVRLIKIKI